MSEKFICGKVGEIIYALGYVRVSKTTDKNQKYPSKESQEQYVLDFAEEHNITILKIFVDDGWSGKDMNRPEIQKMIEMIKRKNIKYVIAYRLDRISRDDESFLQFDKILRENGTSLIFTNDINHPDTPQGHLGRGILLAVSKYERETTGVRVHEKRLMEAKQGYAPGGVAPLGYERESKVWVPSADAHLVQKIFELFGSGKTLNEIANYMNTHYGKKPDRKSQKGVFHEGKYYSASFIRKIIENPVYAGYVRGYKDGEVILYKGRHDGFISKDIWDEFQKKLNAPRPEKTLNDDVSVRMRKAYLLKKILFCSCGANMTVGTSGKSHKDGTPYRYYCCAKKNHYHKQSHCKTAISLNVIENVVFSAIGYMATNNISVSEVKNANNEYIESLKIEHDKVSKNVKTLQNILQNSLNAFVALDNDDTLNESVRLNLKRKSEDLNFAKKRLSQINEELSMFRKKINLSDFQIKTLVENLEFYKESLSDDQKREILKYCVRKIVLSVESQHGSKRICTIVIHSKDETTLPMAVKFSVDNSLGRGIWEIISPFKMSSQAHRAVPKSRKMKQHFLHDVVKLKKMKDDDDLSIRDVAKQTNLKHGMIGRQFKMLENLSVDAIKFVLKLQFERHTKLLTFRKLETISKHPKSQQLKIIKCLLKEA